MGYMTGGLIFKGKASLTNVEILELLKKDEYEYSGDLTMEEATSASLSGIAIARIDNVTFVFGRDLAHSCSFEENETSKLDQRLGSLDDKEILCFLINSVSDTYAWSIFKEGNRVRGKSSAAGKLISEYGQDQEYDKNISMNDMGVIHIIENFTGVSYSELVFENNIHAQNYN